MPITPSLPISPEQYYLLLNFHDDAQQEKVRNWLAGENMQPLQLRGVPHSGRHYLLEASTFRSDWELVGLTWPMQEKLTSTGLAAHLQAELQPKETRRDWLNALGEAVEPELGLPEMAGLGLTLVFKLAPSLKLLKEWLTTNRHRMLDLGLLDHATLLQHLLTTVGKGKRLLLHVRNATQLSGAHRSLLEDACRTLNGAYQAEGQTERVKLAYSLDRLAPAQPEAEEITLQPLDKQRLVGLVDARFRPNLFKGSGWLGWLGKNQHNRQFLQLLDDYGRLHADDSAYYPSLMAAVCANLLDKGLLVQERDGWQLATTASPEGLNSALGAPLRQQLETRLTAIGQPLQDTVRRTLQLAALCDPHIPWESLVKALAKGHQVGEPILTLALKKHFADANLLDWPEQGLGRISNPLLAVALRQQLASPAEDARQLLALLHTQCQEDRDHLPLFLQLAQQAGGQTALDWQEKQQWWQTQQMLPVFREYLNRELLAGRIKAATLLAAYAGKHNTWTPLYSMAVMDACADYYALRGAPTTERDLFLAGYCFALNNAGRYNEALPVEQELLDLRETTLGAEHPDVAASLNNLATLYHQAQGDYAQALPLYLRALAIHEKTLGAEHPNVAKSLDNLAGLYHTQGDYAQALPLYLRALAIYEKTLWVEHPDVASLLNSISVLHREQANYAQALPLCLHALAIREKTLGVEHPNVANSLYHLATLYRMQGDYAQALPFYLRALAICEKKLVTEHPDVAKSLNGLAELYRIQGDYAQALPLHERAVHIALAKLGEQHPDTQQYRENEQICREALAQR